MAKLTFEVPDEVVRRAQSRADAMGRPLATLISDFVRDLGQTGKNFDELLALQNEVMAEIRNFDGGDRLRRDEIHSRKF